MKNTIVILLCLIGFSSAFAQESEWSWKLKGGVERTILLAPESDHWEVAVIETAPGKMQDKISSKIFARESDAREYAVSLKASNDARPKLRAFESAQESPGLVTEVVGESLWPVTQAWNAEWEREYSRWIEESVNKDFFVQTAIATDCADAAISLRWIFSREHGLPAANQLAVSRQVFSNQSIKRSWMRLPTNPDWRRDQRFRSALDYLLNHAYTHTLLRDTYPVQMSRAGVVAGTIILSIYEESGHTRIVRYVQDEDPAKLPMMIFNSTGGRIVRELYEEAYWSDYEQPARDNGGFRRMRWAVEEDRQVVIKPAREMQFYSMEQYEPEFTEGHSGFSDAVLKHIFPNLDLEARIQNGIDTIKGKIQERMRIVEQGYEACRSGACTPGSELYELWSTPSRDHQLAKFFEELSRFAQYYDFGSHWEVAIRNDLVTIQGKQYSIGAVGSAMTVGTYSSEPSVDIEKRWGLTGALYAEKASEQLRVALLARYQKISEQGTECVENPDACEVGSALYNRWNTSKMDTEIGFRFADVSYTHLGIRTYIYYAKDSADLASYQGYMDSHPLRIGPYQRSVDRWIDVIPYLNSDPRVDAQERWGGMEEPVIQ